MQNKKVFNLAQNIKCFLFDVDGIFTDNTVYITHDNQEIKPFSTQDGLGIKLLLKHHITVGLITGRSSEALIHRANYLGIKHLYQGIDDKVKIYEEILHKENLSPDEIAYMGDDLPDLPVLRRAHLSFAPANANHFIKKHVHVITKASGGNGAVREACELILNAQGILKKIHEEYLAR